MAWTRQCPFCGEEVRSDEKHCPSCGRENDVPITIEELKVYCQKRGMPLPRMRFFIGENYEKPKAFGIYEENGRYIVYKNKANGSRAIRYHGPDEEYAVKELFLKLLDECHNRGIYPDGKPVSRSVPKTQPVPVKKKLTEKEKAKRRELNKSCLRELGLYALKMAGIVAAVFLLLWILTTWVFTDHKQDGYYRSNNTVYYKYADDWYYNNDSGNWYKSDFPEEKIEDYYLGKDYESEWGGSDFKESSTWSGIQENHSSSYTNSSDYSGWDSGDTNWDSDW